MKTIDEQILQNNEYYKYNIHIPSSSIYDNRFERKNLLLDIYVNSIKENNSSSEPVLIIGKKMVDIKNLHTEILYYQDRVTEKEIPSINYRFHIDKEIKIKYLIKLKKELLQNAAVQLSYAVKNRAKSYF